jgi:hypothetical protein
LVRRICERFEPASLVVEVSEIIIAKADEPNAIVGLFDSDGLAGEDPAEIDLLPIEADAVAGRDGGGPVMEGIVDFREASIGPRRSAVSLRGTTRTRAQRNSTDLLCTWLEIPAFQMI